MNTNESGSTMTERRRYYALTDDDVETLIRAAETWARTLQMNDRPAEAELRAVSNLTPLDGDDAVTEDMAERAIREQWGSKWWDEMLASEDDYDVALVQTYRDEMRDILNAALGTKENA